MSDIKIEYVGQIVQFFGLPYIVTEITTDYDPYLSYCKHSRAICHINGMEYSGAITDYPNPYEDINAVLSGTKISKYV